MQLVGPTAGPPCLSPRTVDGLDGVHQGRQQLTVVDIGRREPDGKRSAVPVDHHMALAARFAAIRRIRADLFGHGLVPSAPL